MIEFITADSLDLWNESLKAFPKVPVYYLYEYCRAFELHGDGSPLLIKYSDPSSNLEGICVLMLRDVASDPFFADKIEPNKFFDAVTPYGYGGFVFNEAVSPSQQAIIGNELREFLEEKGVVSVFFRFTPVLGNADLSRNIVNVIDLGHTIAMELDSEDKIWENISSKNRNMIRKAEKNGVEIHHGKGAELIEEFIPLYNATMAKDNAHEYYYFKDPFYASIVSDLKDNYEIFYALYKNKIISIAIMLFNGSQMEYHLSGSLSEYRNLAAGNLLLYKAALWGHSQGFKTFHLGGGVGSGEDSLFKFKAAFNRNSDYRFSIGKLIVDQKKYDMLVKLRKDKDPNFNPSSSFFPLYRS